MVAVVVSPSPVLQFFDNAGRPASNGSILTQVGGVNTATYSDSAGTVALPNPIPLNSRGEVSVAAGTTSPLFLIPNTVYTFTLFDANGNQIWVQPYVNGGNAIASNDVRSFGAKFNGVTDDYAAWVAALASGNSVLVAPEGNSVLSAGIVIPPNVIVMGAGCIAGNPQSGGTVLVFSNAVATCVTINNGVNNGGGGLKGCTITRAGGAPPGGSKGVYVYGGSNLIIEEVYSDNHAIPWMFESNASIGAGISTHLDKLFSSRASDIHVRVKTWPELYCFNSRFGANGSIDYNCNAYVSIEGGLASAPAAGPNTIKFIGCQLNQGTNAAAHGVQFVNLNSTVPTIDATTFVFDDCHIEAVSSAGFYSDSTWNILDRLTVTGCVFNAPTVPLFALDVATQPSEWQIVANDFFCSTLALAPTAAITSCTFADNRITGAVTLTGAAGSTVVFDDNSHGANVTINGTYGSLKLSGEFTAGGLIWNGTVTGAVTLEGDFSLGTWTPDITFGGGNTGQTFTSRAGSWRVDGNHLHCDFAIIFSSLGSSTGIAALTGIPFPIVNKAPAAGGGGLCTYMTPMVGLTGPVQISATQVGTSIMNLYQTSPTGVQTINQTNLAANTAIYGTFEYEWQ